MKKLILFVGVLLDLLALHALGIELW